MFGQHITQNHGPFVGYSLDDLANKS
jgi:hypothetical protein